MRTLKIIVGCLLMTISTTTAQNGEKNFIDQPYIEVSGKAEVEVTPNEIYVNITLNENDKKGKVSIETQENQMISRLKAHGVDTEKNLTVKDFGGLFLRKFLAKDQVSKTKNYELLLKDVITLSKVYEALDKIDISNISIDRVDHSDIEKIRRETKINAIKIAKEKAEEYVAAIEQKIGNAIFIQENNFDYNNHINSNQIRIRGNSSNLYGSRASGIKFENINFKNITLTASVLVKFKLI